jgi:glycerol uptake facilitator-like aquaporin
VTASLGQRAAAEALGTMLLLATVVGSGIMGDKLDGGIEAVALLANTLATGAGLVAYITVLGPISGAHFNPAVSLVERIRGKLGNVELLAYVGAQLAGGIVGVLLAHLMFALPVLQLSVHVRTGAGQWLAEALATFGLIVVILGSSARSPERTPVLVGLYIVAAYWFTASTSFANPAVTLARALTDTFAGIRPLDVPGFALAQIAGALLALALGQRLFAQETPGAPSRRAPSPQSVSIPRS